MPLVNLSFPLNASLVSKALGNVASFDVIPTEFVYGEFLKFDTH
jgi:hypothetical protein